MLFNIISIIFSIFNIYLFYNSTDNNYEYLYIPTICAFFIICALFIKCGINEEKEIYTFWIRPTYILLLGLIIVNLQTIINVLLGIGTISDYLNKSEYNDVFGKCLFLGILSIMGFIIGNYNTHRILKLGVYDNVKDTINLWSIFIAIMFVLFVIHIDVGSFINGSSYIDSGAYDRESDSSARYEQLLEIGFIIALSLHCKNIMNRNPAISLIRYITKLPILFIIPFTIYILLRLLSGDRGPVIYNLCSLIMSYYLATHKKIKLVFVAIALIGASFFITILGTSRSIAADMESFSERFVVALDLSEDAPESIMPSTQELANSVNCNFIAVSDIDKNKTDFKHGIYNVFPILTSIPGSLWMLNKLGINARDMMSSEYLTTSFFGRFYPYGLGTTAVAEAYLDFGALGTFLLFLIFGILYKKIDLCFISTKNISILAILFVIRIASITIYIPRSSFAFAMSRVIYTIIIFVVINSIFSILSSKKI